MSKANYVTLIVVKDNEGNEVELGVYQHENGGVFAIDSSYLEQVCDEEDDKFIIPDPFATKFVKLHLLGD